MDIKPRLERLKRGCGFVVSVDICEIGERAAFINLQHHSMRSRQLPAPNPQLVIAVGVPFSPALVSELAVRDTLCGCEGERLGADEGDRGGAVAVVEGDGDDAVGGEGAEEGGVGGFGAAEAVGEECDRVTGGGGGGCGGRWEKGGGGVGWDGGVVNGAGEGEKTGEGLC